MWCSLSQDRRYKSTVPETSYPLLANEQQNNFLKHDILLITQIMLTYINVLKEKEATTKTSKFLVSVHGEIAISPTAIVKVEQAGRMINLVNM